MTVEEQNWRVGLIGLGPTGLYLAERLSLAAEIQLTGLYDASPALRQLASSFGCPVTDQVDQIWLNPETDAVVFADNPSVEYLQAAMTAGKQIVIHQPWILLSQQLLSLARQATTAGCSATATCLRRWSADFIEATTVNHSRRLGSLKSVAWLSYEMGLADPNLDESAWREAGFPLFDQLIQLVDSTAVEIFARQLPEPGQPGTAGFMAMIGFANGCRARIELQTRSRLGFRTGWLLEGSEGSYRDNRLYTVANDGEIVDERLPRAVDPVDPGDAYVQQLIPAWQGQATSLPSLTDAARVVQLIELVESSIQTNKIVRL